MPKPAYGEPGTVIEAGEYKAVITQVVCLGHQPFKDEMRTKYHIEVYLPELETSRMLSNFGIMPWLTPSKPPFVGFYELISAVTKNPSLTQDEAKAYDVFQLAGKSVKVVFEANEKGYMNIVAIHEADGEYEDGSKEILAVGVEDFGNVELLDRINEKARNMIWTSEEFIGQPVKESAQANAVREELKKKGMLDEKPSPAFAELKEEMKEEIKIDEVPF